MLSLFVKSGKKIVGKISEIIHCSYSLYFKRPFSFSCQIQEKLSSRQCYQFSRLPKQSPTNWMPSATEMYFLIVLAASNSRPGCQMVWFLLDKCETESAPSLSPGCRWWAGHLRRSLASRSIIPIFAFIFTEPPLCVRESSSKFPPFRRTSVILDWGPTLTQYDLIVTHGTCNDLVPK